MLHGKDRVGPSMSARDKECIQASYRHDRSPSHDAPDVRLAQGMHRYQDKMFGDPCGAYESAYMECMGYRKAKRWILGDSVMQSDRCLAIREDEAQARDARGHPTVRDCTNSSISSG